MEIVTQLSESEELELVRLLEKAGTGPWPEKVFRAIYATVSMWAAAFVITRNSEREILLAKYDGGTKIFTGAWHIPGGFNLRKERTIAETVARISKRELGVAITYDRVLDAYKWTADEHPDCPLELFLSCGDKSLPESHAVRYFSVNNLPEGLLEPHKRFIEKTYCA